MFRARAEGADHDVALKVLAPDAGAEGRARFRREHATLQRLDHPNILRVHSAGEDAGLPWMALELVDGPDLDAIVRSTDTRPPETRAALAERVMRQLLDALSHVHARGLVHRDIKPSNVLLTPDGDVRLCDFGIVAVGDGAELTHPGRLLGTIAYMAPEIIAEDSVDARADLYGVGAILYALLTGRRPIEADSVAGYLARHLTSRPQAPHEIAPATPPHLERLCLRLLEKDPDRRYPSARAVLDALDAPDDALPPVYGRDALLTTWRGMLRTADGALVALVGPRGSGRTLAVRHLVAEAAQAGVPVVHSPPDGPRSVWAIRRLSEVDDAAAIVACVAAGHLVVAGAEPTDDLPDTPAIHVDTLAPLDAPDVARLLRDHGTPTQVATVLAGRLATSSARLPGDVLAQLDALRREGWLVADRDALRALRTLEAFRTDDLPLPPPLARALAAAYADLDDVPRELLTLLALARRPVAGALLARAAARPAAVPQAIDQLVRAGWIHASPDHDDVTLQLAHPGAGAVVRQPLDEPTRLAAHRALARALGRRHSRVSTEVARHLAAAGLIDEALPLFVSFLQRALRDGRDREAIRGAEEALGAMAEAGRLDAAWRATLLGILGMAQLRRGQWLDAVPSLESALGAAQETDNATLRVQATLQLGQALYRIGRQERAAAYLDAVLTDPAATDTDQDKARRALGDIHLQAGRLGPSLALMREALDRAEGDDAARARAHRGIAHVLGVEGRLAESSRELDAADALLARDGDPRVRTGVMARAIDLDLVAGRYALALQRARAMLDLLELHDSVERQPEALALQALALDLLGEHDGALDRARRALWLARGQRGAWSARLVAVRLLDRWDAVPPQEPEQLAAMEAQSQPLHHADSQRDALVARLRARTPDRLAQDALRRAEAGGSALFAISEASRRVDLAWALHRLGLADEAHAYIVLARAILPAVHADGARFELALTQRAMGLPGGDEAVDTALAALLASTPVARRDALRARAASAR